MKLTFSALSLSYLIKSFIIVLGQRGTYNLEFTEFNQMNKFNLESNSM